MFGFIKKAFTTIYQQFTHKARALFSRSHIDMESLTELEKILISADTGIHTTRVIINNLKKSVQQGAISQGVELEAALAKQLVTLLANRSYDPKADVYLLVGINGSGKTTFAAKLGAWLKAKQLNVLFVAADTFRAAATEQLQSWAINSQVI